MTDSPPTSLHEATHDPSPRAPDRVTLTRPEVVAPALSSPELVPPPPPPSLTPGPTAGLRAAMARFSSGAAHERRRDAVVAAIGEWDLGVEADTAGADAPGSAASEAAPGRLCGAAGAVGSGAWHEPSERLSAGAESEVSEAASGRRATGAVGRAVSVAASGRVSGAVGSGVSEAAAEYRTAGVGLPVSEAASEHSAAGGPGTSGAVGAVSGGRAERLSGGLASDGTAGRSADTLRSASFVATVERLTGARIDLLADVAYRVPVHVLARALGWRGGVDEVVTDVRAVVEVIGRNEPSSPASDAAATRLLRRFAHHPAGAVAAASVLYQAHDATAALIAAMVVSAHDGRARLPAATRTARVALDDVPIAGAVVQAGTVVTLGLDRSLEFGAGPHRCPGRGAAEAIATGVADALAESGYHLLDHLVETGSDGRPRTLPMEVHP